MTDCSFCKQKISVDLEYLKFFFFFFIRLKDIFIDLKINPTGIKTRIYIGNLVFRDTSEDIKHEIVERNCHIHTFDTKI